MNKFNLGISGGKDFSALYFVGLTESDDLLYLDPHYVHESIPLREVCNDERMMNYGERQYHCTKIKSIKLDKMCTSVAIGFYIKNEEEFKEFKQQISKLSKEEDSIFSVYDKKPVTDAVEITPGVVQKVKFDDGMEDEFCVV
jgi:Peptidase family C54